MNGIIDFLLERELIKWDSYLTLHTKLKFWTTKKYLKTLRKYDNILGRRAWQVFYVRHKIENMQRKTFGIAYFNLSFLTSL